MRRGDAAENGTRGARRAHFAACCRLSDDTHVARGDLPSLTCAYQWSGCGGPVCAARRRAARCNVNERRGSGRAVIFCILLKVHTF
ncbi:hypothetical protein EON67_05105 [archaeon]|nr:MAG: hypothetical protein EON67_05105 [archaeon]